MVAALNPEPAAIGQVASLEPGTGREGAVADSPPEAFVTRLRERGVEALSVGRSIVATCEPTETVVRDTIREQGLELQITFN